MPNPSDRLIFVKVQAKDGHFLGQKYEQNSSFCDWWQFGDGRVEGGGAKSSLANEADFNDILKFKIVSPADNT